MIVTCSNCHARYAVDPLAIGPGGRTVQCARCSHRWFQKVEGPKPPPDMVIRPPERGVSLPVPVPARPKPVWGKRLAIAAGILILLGGAGYGGYLYRDRLVDYRDKMLAFLPAGLRPAQPDSAASSTARSKSPMTATSTPSAAASAPAPTAEKPRPAVIPATAAAKPATPRLDPPATAARLEVDLSASKIELVDGRYVVRGQIANHGGTPGSTSKLVITFKKGSDVLGTRTYPLTVGPIAAGDHMTFSQTLEDPPAGATDIVPSVE
jgi:predicted Zn finger-like uncharacterized protein